MFPISVHDVIRCAIDKGRGRRHHLFVFIRPSCLESLITILGSETISTSSAMLIMDVELTGATQMSRLVHIFWTIAKTSAFGPLFSEVDRDVAQELLASNRSYVETRPGGLVPVANTGTSLLTTSLPILTEKPSNNAARLSSKKRGLEAAVAMLSANASAAAASAASSTDNDEHTVLIIDESDRSVRTTLATSLTSKKTLLASNFTNGLTSVGTNSGSLRDSGRKKGSFGLPVMSRSASVLHRHL